MSTGKINNSQFQPDVLAQAFKVRFKKAYSDLESAEGGDRISQAQMGERVAQKLGSARSANAVSGWWTGKSIPDTPVMAALADILGVSPGWLAFGQGEMTVGISQNPVVPLTKEEIKSQLAILKHGVRAMEALLDHWKKGQK